LSLMFLLPLTGNIYNPANLEHIVGEVRRRGDHVRLAVADGEFEIRRSSTNEHRENMQELLTGRLFLSEVLLALKVLEHGGHFVLKLFDTFAHFTLSLIYLCCHLFKEVNLVKPSRSRIVNSERYLVCKFINREHPLFDFVVEGVLAPLHRDCGEDVSPKSAVPLSAMQGDALFWSTMSHVTLDFCEKETRSLKLVLDSYERKKQEGTLSAIPFEFRGGMH